MAPSSNGGTITGNTALKYGYCCGPVLYTGKQLDDQETQKYKDAMDEINRELDKNLTGGAGWAANNTGSSGNASLLT